jgi:hypothetical protein
VVVVLDFRVVSAMCVGVGVVTYVFSGRCGFINLKSGSARSFCLNTNDYLGTLK